jgi:hypothetical protein
LKKKRILSENMREIDFLWNKAGRQAGSGEEAV